MDKPKQKSIPMSPQSVFQVEELVNGNWKLPEGLFSWQVFRSNQDAQRWIAQNYTDLEDKSNLRILEYSEDEIEDISYIKVETDAQKKKREMLADVKSAIANLKYGEEITIYAYDGYDDNDIIPDLALGVKRDIFFDGADVIFCGVYGSPCNFESFLINDETSETMEEVTDNIIQWLTECGCFLCDNFIGLSLKKRK